MAINHSQAVYIPKGEHDDPHELPQQQDLEGSTKIDHTLYSHADTIMPTPNSSQKLEYIYQHFQENEKVHESDPNLATGEIDNTLYPHINNNIEYGLFKDVIDSYYFDSQIKDDFTCNQNCHTRTQHVQQDQTLTPCTHAYDHITHVNNLGDPMQQHTVYTNEVDASLFTTDTTTPCDYNISVDTPNLNNSHENKSNTIPSRGIHSKSKRKYRDAFGNANIQYHDFDNGDALTFTDKYTVLLQQELQNPYWCLHDPITTKSYQISSEMDIDTMPHAMYFSGNRVTITKINQVPYQTIDYDNKGMFQAKLMDNTEVEIFIDNGATPSILPLNVYNKYPILQKYPKTESHTPMHTGGGMIESHFWIEIPLRLENQIIQIKTLVCNLECPYNIVLGHTSLAQLSAWQDYASRQLFIQQISIHLMATNNIRVLPGHTGIISLVLKLSKTSFIPHHTIIGKGIAYVKPFDSTLPLRWVEIEFENNRCCLEVCNTSDCTIEFSTVRRLHILMPDQRALFRLITQNISQLTSTYMTE